MINLKSQAPQQGNSKKNQNTFKEVNEPELAPPLCLEGRGVAES